MQRCRYHGKLRLTGCDHGEFAADISTLLATPIDPQMQIWARQALTRGLMQFDRTKGWRGAVDKVDWPQGFCRRDIGWRAVNRD